MVTDDQMNKAQELFNRGRMLSMKGLYLEAINMYKKALEIDPCHTQARINIQFIRCYRGIGIGEDRTRNVAKTGKLRKATWGRPPALTTQISFSVCLRKP